MIDDSYPTSNDLCKWSDTEPLIALCNKQIDKDPEGPEYGHSLTIINTDTNTAVQQFTILDESGNMRGIEHALVSHVHPGIAYLSLGFGGPTASIAVIDYSTGSVIQYIKSGLVFMPYFIHELPDGRLIVTGGESGKILIIDPT